MDLSSFNLSTVLMITISIALAYTAVNFLSHLISKIICFTIGGLLLIFVLNQFGLTIPVLSELAAYVFNTIKIAYANLQEILSIFK